jgi:class 3 adenylate cyclase/phosphoglycerate-specific signal transduction histidine kinase
MTADESGQSGASRLGIKAKLFLAFCALAGLTTLASAVSWYVFGDIGRAVNRVTAESLPSMVSALSLARKSSEIAVTAPALMASRDQDERVLERARLTQRTEALTAMIVDLMDKRVSPETTDRLAELRARLTTQLEELDGAIEQRLRSKSDRELRLRELGEIHARFLEAAEPLVDDSVFDLVISGERVTERSTGAITGLVQGGVRRIVLLSTLKADVDRAAALLAGIAQASDPAAIRSIRDRFAATAASIEASVQQLSDRRSLEGLQEATAALLAHGNERTKASVESLGADHERVMAILTPLIEDEEFNLLQSTESATERGTDAVTKLIDGGAHLLHVLLTLRAEGNLAAGLLTQAAGMTDSRQLQPLEERFVAAEGQIQRMLGQIPPSIDSAALRSTTAAMLDIGKGEGGLFALRRAELRHVARAQAALDQSRVFTVRLGEEVEKLVAAARDESRATSASFFEAIGGGKVFVIVIAAGSILGAVLVMFYYVGPRVIRPIENVTRAMTDLAAGDTSVDIPGRDRGDELGRMAKALGVFRDTAIEVQESNLREIRETRRRLSDAIESISEAFALYDADDRLVICNTMYRTLLYPGISDQITLGMTFEAIVRRSVERGLIKDAEHDPETWLTERVARHRNPTGTFIQQRGAGRWILVSERKTEDGGTVGVYSDITELKQREQELAEKSNALEQLSNQLAKYLSPQIYESIFTGRQEVKVASQRKKLTVFFSDIAGFTETADRLESEELSQLLNHYLTEMSRIAIDYGATIDKYVGDSIVIFFGDPESRGVKEDALACVKMAIAMRERMRDLQVTWRDSGIQNPLEIRIGINTGFCTVGNFGSEDRMDYTIIGGAVNLASRLESAAPPGEILVAYETFALVKDEIDGIEREPITVKGIAYPVSTYQITAVRGARAAGEHRIREDLSNLQLNLDPDTMSEEERAQAAEILRAALARISPTR